MKFRSLLIPAFASTFIACTPKAQVNNTSKTVQTENPAATAQTEKPTPRWAPKKFDYNASETRVHDLLHTQLEVSFDWNKSYLIGKATLKLKPYFYPSKELVLDAKGMDINAVMLLKNGAKTPLKYDYDGMYLTIQLDKEYTRNEEYALWIDYVSKPNELKLPGSAAITDAKGLYFINPDGSDPNKPRQIWTQGETEGSSCWFPTIDSPNERTTQEMYITVDAQFATLSNGVLVSSSASDDGMRTDYWKMSLPHAPYLFAMAIGDFKVVKDNWRGKEVSYYVEPEYEQYARLIFGNTPEMIEVFSQKTGVDFPWEKYSQVVVQDFVSGAMENTTATIHFSGLQHDAREHLDNPLEDIIAHELFHQWFGDLVTCESWPNLPLNESFATYGEYIWSEHKYGKDAADMDLLGNLRAYLGESRVKREPLIRYYVRHRDDMFDGHSYQKGSRVLHMLRNQIGDDAFFSSLKNYLTANSYKSAEIHNLRLAVEEVTGQDMNWFFNQWFMEAGHPELAIEYGYENGNATIHVTQKQDLRYSPTFRLPVNAEVVVNGQRQIYPIVLETTDTTFSFPASAKPDNMLFDSDIVLLADVKSEPKTMSEWVYQLRNGKNFLQKNAAINALLSSVDKPEVRDALLEATNGEFWGLRLQAMNALNGYTGSDNLPILQRAMDLAKNDGQSSVRRAALRFVGEVGVDQVESAGGAQSGSLKDQVINTLLDCIQDSSYGVLTEGLKTLAELDPTAALTQAKALEGESSEQVSSAVGSLYMKLDQPNAIEYVADALKKMKPGFSKYLLISEFGKYVGKQEGEKLDMGIKALIEQASGIGTYWIRSGAAQALKPYADRPEVQEYVTRQLEIENNDVMKEMLEDMKK